MRAEVYDHTGTEIVGYLDGVADLNASRANSVSITLDRGSESDPLFDPWSIKTYRPTQYVALKVMRVSRRFDRDLRLRDPRDFAAMVASVIPEGAQSIEDITHNDIVYQWAVLMMPDKYEVAEKVFELDGFEPEGKSCSAWAAEERWWVKRGMMPRQHRTVIDASAIKTSSITMGSVSTLKGSWLRARER